MFTRTWLERLRTHGDPYGVQVRPDGREEIFRGRTPVVFPQPGHFDYGLRIAAMDAAGIDISIVSLTCPNVYWGGEVVSSEAARESNASMAEAQRSHGTGSGGSPRCPWEYPERALAELAPLLRRGRRRGHGHRQYRRPEPYRSRRSRRSGPRSTGVPCPSSSILASRPARTSWTWARTTSRGRSGSCSTRPSRSRG